MMRAIGSVWATALVCGVIALGCSGGRTTGSPGTTTIDPTEQDAGGTVDTEVAEPTVPEMLPLACDDDTPCAGSRTCMSGVCLTEPGVGEEGVLHDATGVAPYPAGSPPNLSCVDLPVAAPEGPETATLYGAVARFGSGNITTAVQVEVFRAEDWNPTACEAIADSDDKATCYREYGGAEHVGTYGLEPLGTAVSFPAGDKGEDWECEGHAICPLGYECLEGDVDHTCQEQFGLYSIDGIPTNTPLVIRSYSTVNESKWHDVYMFGIYLYADRVDGEGRYHFDVTMVSAGQWQLTANIAGLSIPPDHGAIGGRVRDCRVVGQCKAEGDPCTVDQDCAAGDTCEGGRASWPIGGAAIGLAEPALGIVYFNNLENDTVPLDFRTTTNILGRYAALDIPSGWNRIAAAVRLEGEVVSVGGASVYVVPDALSIIGWPGYQPHWKQD